jgi:ABC-type Fe3+/spermidine/putrescine transport system ATPase subunit/sugar lactone lactonase YvrE
MGCASILDAMAADPLWQLDAVALDPARLCDVSLTIRRGVTAVIGWSGAGKTSLLNVLAGFEHADRGTITGAPSVAWVPQNGGLWPHCTAREHLAIASGSSDGLDDLLTAFDLADKRDAHPHELSEGEQSRLAVARALAARVEVLVMDEPLVHVDPARASGYWRVIREHVAATGASLIFSTHVPETVLGEAQRAICLRAGRVLHEGPVADLYQQPATEELMTFLGPGNWLTPEDARHWLKLPMAAARCVRPEQIAIEPATDGAFSVESVRFRGTFAETELRNGTETAARQFYHRPNGDKLRPGMRVRITALLCLAVLFFFAGCKPTTPSSLTAREWRAWSLPPEGASLPTPRSLATGLDDEIAALDTAGRVLVFSAEGALKRQWHMLDVKVGKPEGIVVLKDGRVVVCDTHYHRVVWFDPVGHWLKNIGRKGEGAGEFFYPVGICKDADENLYICEYGGNDRVQKFTREGQWLASFGSFGTEPGQFQRPSGLTWLAGKIYVTDAVNNRVLIFTDAGKYVGVLGAPDQPPIDFDLPYDIAAAPDGALYIIEYGAGRLTKVTPEGRLLGRYGRTGSGEGEFATPWGLTIDSRMRVCIADTKNRRIVALRL